MGKWDTGRLENISHYVIVITFLAVVSLPFLGGLIAEKGSVSESEKRRLTARPTSGFSMEALQAFPSKYEAYFNDSFCFRQTLIRWTNYIRYAVLGVSPTYKVIVGLNGWLYYSERGDVGPGGAPAISPEVLDNWEATLESRRRWLAKRDIQYLVVLVPEKDSIYPEFLPDSKARRSTSAEPHPLASRLRARTRVEVVDLTDVLREHGRSASNLYLMTDSHWTDLGAFIGYERIMLSLAHHFPYLVALKLDSLRSGKGFLAFGGDLAAMLGTGQRFNEEYVTLSLPAPVRAKPSRVPDKWINREDWCKPFATEIDDPSLPKAVMFRDSFSIALVPFLSEHFRRIVFRCGGFNRQLVLDESPDLVIDQIKGRLIQRQSIDGETPDE